MIRPACFVVCALVLLSTGLVRAESQSVAPPSVEGSGALAPTDLELAASIEIENLPSCIDEASLEARVASLVRAEYRNPERKVHGRLTSEGAEWAIEFQVFEGESLVGRRRLTFEQGACEPLRENMELVLAMLLEGKGFEPRAEPPPAAPPVAPAAPPAEPTAKMPEERPAPTRRRVRGRFRFGGELAVGVMPAPAPGLRLEGGLELPFPLALLLRASWHPEGSVPAEGGRLEVGGYRLGAAACYLHRRTWTVSACAGVGFVALEAAGVDVPGARGTSFDTGSVAAGARLGVPLSRAWSLELGAEIEAWFARPEYVLLAEQEPLLIATGSGVPLISWLAVGYDF